MGKEAGAAVYDAMHYDETVYDLPTEQSPYYPLFRGVVDQIERRRISSVLEVGCGSGGLAELLLRSPAVTAYRGFDFSPVGVRKAGERTRRPELFFVGDAL